MQIGGEPMAQQRGLVPLDTLNIRLEFSKLPRQFTTALRRNKIRTLGELAVVSERDLASIGQIGPKAVLDIQRVLAEHGIPQVGNDENKRDFLVRLYGSPSAMPALLLKYCLAPRTYFDKDASLFLYDVASIGQLTAMDETDIAMWLKRTSTNSYTDIEHRVLKGEVAKIKLALKALGLRLKR